MEINPQATSRKIEDFMRQKLNEFKRDGVILGMSGGIDSSVTAFLLVRAIGSEKVKSLLLPERDSSPDSKTDAMKEIDRLGIHHREFNLTPLLKSIGIYQQVPLHFLGTRRIKESIVQAKHRQQQDSLGETPFLAGLLGTKDLGTNQGVINAGNAYARIKHRLRMMILYYYADLENLLVVGTTNKSEAMTGFVVKWGDNVADIEPILPLYKTQVGQLAEYLGVDKDIIHKAPTPDLMPGIEDEVALGIDYPTLDKVLWGLEQGLDQSTIVETYEVNPAQVEHVRQLVQRSEHLRQLPPYPELG